MLTQCAQSSGHPSHFTFARNAEALFFLASGQSYEQSLYYVLVPQGSCPILTSLPDLLYLFMRVMGRCVL